MNADTKNLFTKARQAGTVDAQRIVFMPLGFFKRESVVPASFLC